MQGIAVAKTLLRCSNVDRIMIGLLARIFLLTLQLVCGSRVFAESALPWDAFESSPLPLAVPERDYRPIAVPNGQKAEYWIVDGVKVFHLVIEPIEWSVMPGLVVKAWGVNGSFPGPVIEVGVGDRVKIYVTNRLEAPTTIHWHGLRIPCGMDGVAYLTQPVIQPGETFLYTFVCPDSGTFMYHSHYDPMTQEGMGIVGMFIVQERISDPSKRPDRDYALLLHEWSVPIGTGRPNPNEMTDFNVLTINGRSFPATEPLEAWVGERVWIRYGNLSAMDHHPMHLHGHSFKVIGSDGGWVEDKHSLLPETTVLVPVGTTRVTELIADNPGDWILHCHMTHHTMNQMGHNSSNMISVDAEKIDKAVKIWFPHFMAMGSRGMGPMGSMHMEGPKNAVSTKGSPLQYGSTIMGGMATVLKVRNADESMAGWYRFSKTMQAHKVSSEDLRRDGIEE